MGWMWLVAVFIFMVQLNRIIARLDKANEKLDKANLSLDEIRKNTWDTKDELADAAKVRLNDI